MAIELMYRGVVHASVVQPFTGDWESEEQRELYRRYLDVCRLECVPFVGLSSESAGLAAAWGLEGGRTGFESGCIRGAHGGSKRFGCAGRGRVVGGRGFGGRVSGGRGAHVGSWGPARVSWGADGGGPGGSFAGSGGTSGVGAEPVVTSGLGDDHGDIGDCEAPTTVGVSSGRDACTGVFVGGEAGSGRSCATDSKGESEVLGRGPNWERNRAARDKKKRQKQVRNLHRESLSGGAGNSGSSSGQHCASVAGAGFHGGASADLDLVRENQEGFWNSCSKEVRQELIDSKARMHIAENLRKAKEAEEKVRQMESPEALLVRAMAMVSMAEQCAKKSNDSKVAGWAQTVATSYAESIAKSAPSSVPSYASVLSRSSATSVSVDGTKRVESKGPQDKQGIKHAHSNLTAKQSVDMFGLRLSESRTEKDLDEILSDAADDPRIVGYNLDRIVTIVIEKRRKFQRAAERAEIQRLGGAA